jgi:transcriptional regulator of acetoin/glycerol metabolism
VCGRVPIELQQHIGVIDDLGDCLGVLDDVVDLERLDRDLGVVDVTVPPRRQRTADLSTVTSRVLAELAPHREARVSVGAMRLIERYIWPRNVLQLEEALASALKKRPVGSIEENDLPGYCHTTARWTLSPLEQADRDAVIAALKEAGGNRVHAAKALGLARSSLYRRLKNYGITTV